MDLNFTTSGYLNLVVYATHLVIGFHIIHIVILDSLNEKGTDDIEEEAISKKNVGSKKGNNCN
ncbi:MAG: hypothetical protein WCF23_22710 [Candidatus Nitrosopolaris sp.]